MWYSIIMCIKRNMCTMWKNKEAFAVYFAPGHTKKTQSIVNCVHVCM